MLSSANNRLKRLAARLNPISRKTINAALAHENLTDGDDLFTERCATIKEYGAYIAANAAKLSARARFERQLVTQADYFSIAGYCAVCHKPGAFAVDFLYTTRADTDVRLPNWRERLVCHKCRLPSRQRAMIDCLSTVIGLRENATIYVTEQMTPFFRELKRLHPRALGSEMLRDGTPRGMVNRRGTRNENLTRLSFADASFDIICTADVLEHVPAFHDAISECYRCLKDGGLILISVPFLLDSAETLVRARVATDGAVEHLLPPEYHGDPLDRCGVLCYYHFGWDLLAVLKDAGFADAGLHFYWSANRAYLGGTQFLILAFKGKT